MPSLKPGHLLFRIGAGIVAVLLLVGLVALVSGPGRGMRGDIARQKQLITQQLAVTREQLALTQKQFELSQEQLAIARRQLEIAETQLKRTDETLALQRQLLAIAQATLEQAREINRKTPNAGAAAPLIPARP